MSRDSAIAEHRFPAQTSCLDEVLAFVTSGLERDGFPAAHMMQLEVAAEEIFVNICHYSGLDPDDTIRIRIDSDPQRVRISFADHGRPFNPLELPEPDIGAPAPEREIGGLGIHMVRNLVDALFYTYVDSENVLVLEKDRTSQP